MIKIILPSHFINIYDKYHVLKIYNRKIIIINGKNKLGTKDKIISSFHKGEKYY